MFTNKHTHTHADTPRNKCIYVYSYRSYHIRLSTYTCNMNPRASLIKTWTFNHMMRWRRARAQLKSQSQWRQKSPTVRPQQQQPKTSRNQRQPRNRVHQQLEKSAHRANGHATKPPSAYSVIAEWCFFFVLRLYWACARFLRWSARADEDWLVLYIFCCCYRSNLDE